MTGADSGDGDATALSVRVEQLEERVRRLEARLVAERASGPGPHVAPPARTPFASEPPRAVVGSVPFPRAATAPRGAARRAHGGDLEHVLGGNLLAKAGMLVLVLGVAFALRYAFEHDWIGRGARIVLGIVGGAVVFAVGEVLHRRSGFGAYPQVLAGGGAVIAYFAVFAAHAFPDYRAATGLGGGPATLALALIALGVAAYATARAAPTVAGVALSLVAVTAGFAGAWTSFGVAYALLLGAGLAVAAAIRRWPFLAAADAVVVFGVLATGLAAGDTPASQVAAASLVAIGMFGAVAAVIERATPRREGGVDVGPFLAGGAAVVGWAIADAALQTAAPAWRAPVLFALAAVTLAGGTLAIRVRAPGVATGAFIGGVVLALAWPIIAFDAVAPRVMAWAALGALASIAAALRGSRRALPLAAAAFVAVASVGLVVVAVEGVPPVSVGGLAAHGAFWSVGVAIVIAWAALRHRGVPAAPAALDLAILAVGVLDAFLYLGVVLDGFWVSASWGVTALALAAAGFATSNREVRLAGLGAFGLVILRLFLFDLGELDLGTRIVVFLVVGVLLLVGSFLYAKRDGSDRE